MKKYDGYENTEVFTGDYETLEAGGYICKILKVATEEKEYGTLLRIGFDIEEGEHKGYYKRQLDRKKETNPDAKWQGMYYQTVKQDDLKYFKSFIVAIENSNSAFKWDWNESKLVGKLFGGVFGQEEYVGHDSKVKMSTKCRFVKSVEQVKNGVEIPAIKKLTNNTLGTSQPADDDDELPF